MNWVRYTNKKEEAIRRREQEWFAKREAKTDNPSAVLNDKLATNAKPIKNLDLQRILNFTEEAKRKNGRVIVNKVNMDRRSSPKYHSVDLDKVPIPRRPFIKLNGCGSGSNINSYISTSSPLKSSEKLTTRRYEKNHCHKIYNCLETLQVEKHHRFVRDEKDQPFFLKHNDLASMASMRRVNDVASRTKNNVCSIMSSDAEPAYHSKEVGLNTISYLSTHQSSIFTTQASNSWKDDITEKQVNDYFEYALLPPKSSKIVSFNDHGSSNVRNIIGTRNMSDSFKGDSLAENDFELTHKKRKPITLNGCIPSNVEMEMKVNKECSMECLSYASSPCESEDVVSSNNTPNNSPKRLLLDQHATNTFEKEHVHSPSFALKMDKSQIDASHLMSSWKDKLASSVSNSRSTVQYREERVSMNSTEIYHLQKNCNYANDEDFVGLSSANGISKNSECISTIKENRMVETDLETLGFSVGQNIESKRDEMTCTCQKFASNRNCDVECQTDLKEMGSFYKISHSLKDVSCQTLAPHSQTPVACTDHMKQVIEEMSEELVAEDATLKALDLSTKRNSQKDFIRENSRSCEQLPSQSEECLKICIANSVLPVGSSDLLEFSESTSEVKMGEEVAPSCKISNDNVMPELQTVEDFQLVDVKLNHELNEQCLEEETMDSESSSLYESPLKCFI